MPSVFTLSGSGKPRRERKPKAPGLSGPTPPLGYCKLSNKVNPKTGKRTRLCYVGKDKSRSGWLIKGSE